MAILGLKGDVVFVLDLDVVNPLSPKGPPIDEQTHLALDRGKSISGTIWAFKPQ